MRKLFTILVAVLLTASIFLPEQACAQSPEKMSYQAVVRDSDDNMVTDTQIGMQISILQGTADGGAVYVETQTPTTNANGLVSIEIGGGTGFNAIDWSAGPYFIKTETDPTGGTSYTITGTSQLLSVPFALHAKSAETVSDGISENDPVFTAWDKSTGISIMESQVSDLGNYIETETDPIFGASVASGISASDTTNWKEAHGWGNHAEAEYLTEETDPLFTSSVASEITQEDTESWDAKSEFDGEFASLTGVPNSVIMPSGVINMFAGGVIPDGYFVCDGSEVSRTEYADLFAAIGTTYGEGDGTTTFNLPNLQSRVPVGMSTDTGFDQLGNTGGTVDHTLTVDEMPSHSHTGSSGQAGDHNHNGNTEGAGAHSHTGSTSLAGSHMHAGTTNAAGGHTHLYSRRELSTNTGGTTMSGAYYAGGTSTQTTSTSGDHSHNLSISYSGTHSHSISINTVANHGHALYTDISGSHEHSVSIDETGGGIAHNNLQPYIVINFIIKY